jgi:hypothetical protein
MARRRGGSSGSHKLKTRIKTPVIVAGTVRTGRSSGRKARMA